MIYGERLKQARELHRFTQAQLGGIVGIKQAAIALVENDKRTPSPAVVQAIAEATKVTVAFFKERPLPHFEPGSLSYRSRTKIRAVERSQVHQFTKLFVEQTRTMLASLSLPRPELPVWDEPAIAAGLTRASLGIDHQGPLPHAINLLEHHGAVVFRLPVAPETIDAFSTWVEIDGERPIIVLSAGLAGDRIRSNVAHELGHLVMHKGMESPDAEREANDFAAAFLLPEELMRRSVSDQLNLTIASRLKSRWQVSIQMIVRRARDLGIIPEKRYRTLFKQIGARGWRKNEPVEVPLERPRVYRQMAEILYGADVEFEMAESLNIERSLAQRMLYEYNAAFSGAQDLRGTQPYRIGLSSHINN